MRAAPQRDRFDPPKVRRSYFALSKCAPHHNMSNSTHPMCAECSKCAPRHSESNLTPKCAEGSLRMLTTRAPPQRERLDPPKVRRRFASLWQNVRRATARAISLSQSDALATKSTPRRTQNAHRTTTRAIPEGSLRVLKMCTAPQLERSR